MIRRVRKDRKKRGGARREEVRTQEGRSPMGWVESRQGRRTSGRLIWATDGLCAARPTDSGWDKTDGVGGEGGKDRKEERERRVRKKKQEGGARKR